MSRWRVILAAIVIFAAGMATGGVVVRTYFPKVVRRMHPSQPIPISNERRNEYISRLDREVSLTEEQRKRVEGILAASQARMKGIWDPIEPRMKEEYRRTRSEISEILSPEQREKMKQWHAQREQRWRGEGGTNNFRGNNWRERNRGDTGASSTNRPVKAPANAGREGGSDRP